PQIMLESVIRMSEFTKQPLAAQPNAGFPKLVDSRYIYLCSPDYMSKFSKRFIQAGVRILGGCCGTTPDHVKSIKTVVRMSQPSRLFITGDTKRNVAEPLVPPVPTEQKTGLSKKLAQGKFVVSVEVDPPKGVDVQKVLAAAEMLKNGGVDV